MIPLSHLISEQRAVYLAELDFDRARDVFLVSIKPGQGCVSWAARVRYYDAELALQGAVARLEKRKCELTGRRHLVVVSFSDSWSSDHPTERGGPHG